MKKLSSLFFLFFIVIFLSSCHRTQDVKKEGLFDPVKFVEEREERIEKTVALGPNIDTGLDIEKKIRNNERRQINKEERKNYINIAEGEEELFPITINFENVSIQDMAVMFSEITGKNILVGDEVDGKITAKLVNVPWDKALDSILKTKKLAKHVNGKANIIRIHKQDVLVAQEEFDRKRIEDLEKTREAQRAIEPIYTEIFRLYYTKAQAVKSEIQSVMGTGSSDGSDQGGGSDSSKQVKITIDDRLNSLIIQATKSELDLISRLIKEVDVRTKQILIEAFIVEATDEFTKNLGARLGMDATNLSRHGGHPYDVQASGLAGGASNVVLGGASGSLSNLAVANPTAGIGFIFNSTSSALKIELTAAQLEEKTQLISNPRVFTLDNEQAVIIEGEEIPYEVPNEEGGVEIEMKEAGIKLTVTPSIIGDGNIILDVEIERKTVKGTSKNPPLLTRKITTKLLIKDKTIVVIGGVMTEDMTNTVKKVPFFGDLPFIGRLFRNDADKNKKKELLIFLAPRII